MCGIHASISIREYQTPSAELSGLLQNRGPDHNGTAETRITGEDGQEFWLHFTSTVLSLRGGHITRQPFTNASNTSLLCWNGEAWKYGPEVISGNDGEVVFAALSGASSALESTAESTAAILKILRDISGPFAFVFFDKPHGQLFFGRDRLGRRSLLYNTLGQDTCLEFSSISDPQGGEWVEVEADAVYQLILTGQQAECAPKAQEERITPASFGILCKHSWSLSDANSEAFLGTFNRIIPDNDSNLKLQSESVQQLQHNLRESMKLRILNLPTPPGMDLNSPSQVRMGILFSGGLDCTVLARIAHDILPRTQAIDLINVAFENPRVAQAARNAKRHVQHESPVEKRLNDESRISSVYEKCPDRATGRASHQELLKVCPERAWRFVAVNVPYTETVAHRSKVVQLINPHNTEMDLSIAYALYFAARGIGLASTVPVQDEALYTSTARVLLSGLGADELFGGYTRHATAFNRTGYPGLLDELKLDIDRLGKRNLGRDDRVISHWSREVRFPYLDENLVRWAVEKPITEKCGFSRGSQGILEVPNLEAGKKVLRLLAHNLGMHAVAQEKKRAIQFGARTAKMDTGRTKGTTLIS